MNKAFIQGFIYKCAQAGINPRELLKYAATDPTQWQSGGAYYNAIQEARKRDDYKTFMTNWRKNNDASSFSDKYEAARAAMNAYHSSLSPEARKELFNTEAYQGLKSYNQQQRAARDARFADNSAKLHAGNANLTPGTPGAGRTVGNNYGGTIDTSALRQRRTDLANAQKMYLDSEKLRKSDPAAADQMAENARRLEATPQATGNGEFSYVDPRTGQTVNNRAEHAINMNDRAIAANTAEHNRFVATHPGSQRVRTYAHNSANPNASEGTFNRFTATPGTPGTGANITPAPQPTVGFRGPVAATARRSSLGGARFNRPRRG